MKTLTLLKILTIGMTLLIVLGITFIAYKLTNSGLKSKSFSMQEKEIELPFGEEVKNMFSCGKYVCVLIQGNNAHKRLWTLDPYTGKIQSQLIFKESVY